MAISAITYLGPILLVLLFSVACHMLVSTNDLLVAMAAVGGLVTAFLLQSLLCGGRLATGPVT